MLGIRSETGQAAPLYITAVVGLLFFALVFFAFGEAGVQRNGAQSAADASALAAAKESRGLLEADLKTHLADPDFIASVFSPSFLGSPENSCWKASAFGALNKASAVRCRPLTDGRWGYEVSLKSDKGMSTNIVPGTEGKKAEAQAVAVVEPRCSFAPEPEDTPEPESTPDPGSSPETDEDSDPETPAAPVGKVRCDGGKEWTVDPEDPTLMPDVADLFSVHLAEK
ncbi:pilus assembly protein TadG-related protein [Streptomyces sp. NPDC052291]|uniref:pilus assembly protein TadG-related protein n=1 Tax=Streptomyces sp. NPDC052291 TaxID=3161011 RepID=UPI003412F4DC